MENPELPKTWDSRWKSGKGLARWLHVPTEEVVCSARKAEKTHENVALLLIADCSSRGLAHLLLARL